MMSTGASVWLGGSRQSPALIPGNITGLYKTAVIQPPRSVAHARSDRVCVFGMGGLVQLPRVVRVDWKCVSREVGNGVLPLVGRFNQGSLTRNKRVSGVPGRFIAILISSAMTHRLSAGDSATRRMGWDRRGCFWPKWAFAHLRYLRGKQALAYAGGAIIPIVPRRIVSARSKFRAAILGCAALTALLWFSHEARAQDPPATRDFSLSFVTSLGESLDEVRVLIGGSAEVRVMLNNAGALLEGESVRVVLQSTEVTLVTPELTLSARMSSAPLVINAGHDLARLLDLGGTVPAVGFDADATEVQRDGEAVDDTHVSLAARLPVPLVEREFMLVFTTLLGEMLDEARVLAGGSTMVRLRLVGVATSLGSPSLGSEERVAVPLSYAGSGVTGLPSPVEFSAMDTEVVVTLAAAFDAMDGTLRAVDASGDILMGGGTVARVDPASLAVEVVERQFRLELGGGKAYTQVFSPGKPINPSPSSTQATITVVEDVLIESLWVFVSITPSRESQWIVELEPPGGGEPLRLHEIGENFGGLRRVHTSRDQPLDRLVGTGSSGEWVLTVSSFSGGGGTLDAWGIGFGTPVRVLANASTVFVARLVGVDTGLGVPTLAMDQTLSINEFGYVGVGVLVERPMMFSAENTEVGVTLTASTDASDGLLSVAALPDSLANMAVIPPALRAVEVSPRRFRIELDVAGEIYTRSPGVLIPDGTDDQSVHSTITVDEDVPIESLWVAVLFTHPHPELDLRVELQPPGAVPLVLHKQFIGGQGAVDLREIYTSRDQPLDELVGTRTRGEWVLTVGDYQRGTDGRLDAWGIGFGTQVRVPAGASTMVTMRLVGVDTPLGSPTLFPDEKVEASIGSPDGFIYGGEGVMVEPATLAFTRTNTEVEVTLTVSVDSTPGTLFARANTLANAISPFVALEVGIEQREFALVFTPPEIGILVGEEATVSLSLTGASLIAGETVTVALVLVDASTVTLVTSTLAFDANTISREVVLQAAPDTSPGTTRLLASAPEIPNASFADAELRVNVVGGRQLTWVFRSAETNEELPDVVVVAGATTRLLVSLEGTQGMGLLAGERVEADLTLTAMAGLTMSPSSLMLNVDMMSQEVVLTADAGAMPGDLVLLVTRTTPDPLPSATLQRQTTLPVRVLREFTLSFTTLEDEPLDTARVLAGGSTAVRVTVSNAGVLFDDEMVTVSLVPDAAVTFQDLDFSAPHFLTLSKQVPRREVTIGAAHDARPPSGTVEASGEVRSGGAAVMDTRVLSTTLAVEIAPRQFRIELDGAGIVYTRSLGVLIPDGTSMQSVRSTITVVEDVQIDSLWVAVSIAHESPGDLVVELVPPDGGAPLRLHDRTGTGDSFYLRRLYTSRDEPLRSLRGTSASGEWELTVGDYEFSDDVGTLDMWGIGFGGTLARVLAGASTVVTMRLVGVDTGLGTPMLSGGETVTVDMFAYIGGSGVGMEPFTFTADETQVEVTVTASAAASAGLLSAAASPALPVNTMVEPVARRVAIAPRRFRIELDVAGDSYTRSFSPGLVIEDNTDNQSVSSTIEVEEDITIDSLWVAVSITHLFTEDLIVELNPPGVSLPLRLHVRAARVGKDLRRAYTSREPPLDSLLGTDAQGEWVLTVGDYEDGEAGTLDAWGIGFGTQARVVAGASTMVTARLVGVYTRLGSSRLFPGEAVEFSAFEYAGMGVEAAPFSFMQGSTEVDMTLTASADATTGTLFAVAIAPVNTALEPPFVALAVGIDPREFALVFTPPEIGILTGGEATVTLSLTGASLVAGETVTVALVLEDPSTVMLVSPSSLVFDMDTMPHEVVLRAAPDTSPGTTRLLALASAFVLAPATPNVRFASGELLVNVVGARAFVLSFTTPEGDALEEALVLAGGSTAVRVVLDNFEELLESESVQVSLTASTVTVNPPLLTLTEDEPYALFTISAAHDAMPLSGTVMASGRALLGGAEVVDTEVLPASLPVEIAPRQFRIGLDIARVAYTRSPGEAIPDDREAGFQDLVRSSIEVSEDITVESLRVTVSITHPTPGELQVVLFPPGVNRTRNVLHTALGGDEPPDLRRTYTSLDAPLRTLLGVQARGTWTLQVSDTVTSGSVTGTLDGWSIRFDTQARVPAGAATMVTARLVGVDTGLGTPMLSGGETVTVGGFGYDGVGVGVTPPALTLTFTADEPQVEVTLTASTAASAGLLSSAMPTALPVNTMVEPAAWTVAIAPRRFKLELDVAGDVYTRNHSPGVVIPQSEVPVRSTIEVEKDIRIDSLWVAVSITQRFANDLIIELVPPEGNSLTLYNGLSLPDRRNLRRVYTSQDAPLDLLLGTVTNMRDNWTLVVRNLVGEDFGTLDAWAIGFNTQVRLLAGASTVLTMRLVAIDTPLGTPMLSPGETVEFGAFEYDGVGVGVTPSTLIFTQEIREVDVSLEASVDAMSGALFAVAGTLVNIVVEPPFVALDIGIEQREFAVLFTTLEDEPLDTARVLAGGATEVRVVLDNPDALHAGEAVEVLLAPDAQDFGFPDRLLLTLTAAAPSMTATIVAAHDATPPLGTVIISGVVRLNDGVAPNTRVLPATLAVEIVPRQFRLELGGRAYTLSPGVAIPSGTTQLVRSTIITIIVDEDITIESFWVFVSITHPTSGDLRVELNPPGGSPLRLHDRTGGFVNDLRRVYTARDDPLDELVGTRARGEWVLTVGDHRFSDVGTLDRWGIGFGTPARVLANASMLFVARLVGVETPLGSPELFPGETVTVDTFAYSGMGVEAAPFAFTVVSTGTEVSASVSLTASAGASDGLLSAAASPGSLPVNAAVESGARVVEIAPRRFRLELDVAGDSYTRSFSPGLLIKDNTMDQSASSTIEVEEDIRIDSLWVAVSITHTYRGDLLVELNPPGGGAPLVLHATSGSSEGNVRRVYTAQEPPLDGLIRTQAQGEWTLTAGDYDVSDFGTLDAWGIGFGTQVRVVAGASTVLTMRLVRVDMGLGLPTLHDSEIVGFGVFEYAGMGVMAAPFFGFTQASREVGVTLTASADATTGTLFAVVLPLVNVVLEPPFVALTVDIAPREFALVFTPAEIGILVGEEATVSLSLVGLTGASLVPGDLAVMVELTLSHPDELTLVTPATLAFDASTMIHAVTLSAAGGAEALEGATLSASVVADHGVAHAMFASGSLLVNVIDRREFMWVFRSAETNEKLPEVVVVTGATTRLLVSLEDAQGVGLLAGDQVEADLTLTAMAGLTVSPSSLMLNVDMMSREVVLTADAGAMAGMLTLLVTQPAPMDVLPSATLQRQATLPVLLAREFTVSFTTLEDEPLDTARVLAGGSTAVRVVLDNFEELLESESVQVSLSGNIVTTDETGLTLTAERSSATFIVNAAHDATPPLGTVMASGEVLLNSIGVSYTAVLSATLPVEIVARQFRIELDVAGGSYTRSFSPGLEIEDNTGGDQSVRSTIEVEEDITIDSLWVAVSITHPDFTDLVVELTGPDGRVRTLLQDPQPDIRNLRRVYTPVPNDPIRPLYGLVGTQAQGEWVLMVNDNMDGAVGTLDAWGISFVTQARVVAGASAVVTMRLVGGDTGLGTPMLSGGETVTVDMFAYIGGRGVGVTPPAFPFTADSTQVDVTVTASADASAGFLSAAASPGSLPVNAAVESGARVVEIAPRRFRLELDVAGDSYTRSFSSGLLIEDNTGDQSVSSTIEVEEDIRIDSLWVAVSITHQRRNNLKIELVPPGGGTPLVLHDQTRSNSFRNVRRVYTSQDTDIPLNSLLETGAQGEWVLTVGDYEEANVGRLEAWGIGFGTQARVVAGASTMVTARLVGVYTRLGSSRLFPGEAVEFSAFEYASVGVEAAPFSFTQGSTEVDLTLTASADATTGTLFAVAIAPVNTVLEPPFVAFAVGIDPREFALVFTPPQIGILVGEEATASLSLAGASLIAGETVTVALVLEDPSTVMLVTSATLVFDANTAHKVMLQAAPDTSPGTTRLLASAPEIPNARFADAELRVNVVGEREFMWVFRSAETNEELPEVVVVTGATTRLLVSLEDAQGVGLLAGEQVKVTLTVSPGITVVPDALTLSADASSQVVVLTADIGAMPDDPVLLVTQLAPMEGLPRATLQPQATLPVRALREFTVSFTTLEDEPLDTARVLAGGSTAVRVVLDNFEELLESESVQVSLSGNIVTTDETGLTLTAQQPSTSFTIGAPYNVLSLQSEVTVSGEVWLLSDSAPVLGTRVVSTSLQVEVTERRFKLMLSQDEIFIGRNDVREVELSLIAEDDLGRQSMLVVGEQVEFTLTLVGDALPGVTLTPQSGVFTRAEPSTTLTIETRHVDAADGRAVWKIAVPMSPMNTEEVPEKQFAATLRAVVRLRVRALLEGPLQ